MIQVRCKKCNEWIDENDVKCLDVSEGPMGKDIMTFICPICKSEQKSTRVK